MGLSSAKHSPCSLLPMTLPGTWWDPAGAALQGTLLCSSFVKKQCSWLKRHYTDNRKRITLITENTFLQDGSVKSLKLVLFCSWSCFWNDPFYPSFITSYMQYPSTSPPSTFFLFKTGWTIHLGWSIPKLILVAVPELAPSPPAKRPQTVENAAASAPCFGQSTTCCAVPALLILAA